MSIKQVPLIYTKLYRPLLTLMCYYANFTEDLVFQLKKRPPDYAPRKGRKPDNRMGLPHGSIPPEKLPYLVELSPGDTQHTLWQHIIFRAEAEAFVNHWMLAELFLGQLCCSKPALEFQLHWCDSCEERPTDWLPTDLHVWVELWPTNEFSIWTAVVRSFKIYLSFTQVVFFRVETSHHIDLTLTNAVSQSNCCLHTVPPPAMAHN